MSSPYATINWQRQRILTLETALRDLIAGISPDMDSRDCADLTATARAALLPVADRYPAEAHHDQ